MENNTPQPQPQGFFETTWQKNKHTIILAAIAIIVPFYQIWTNFNQKEKDKMTDIKIEQLRIENAEKQAMYNRNLAYIYGALADVRNKLDADRCFIIQPHPPDRHHYVSVIIESNRPGVSAVRDVFQNVPMSDMGEFAKLMSTNMWLYFDDINAQVNDKKALSLMLIAGSMQIGIRQLTNSKNEWVGSLVVENIQVKSFEKVYAMEVIDNCANRIQ